MQALHVKDQLKTRAVELGIVKEKKKTFFEKEIAPFFQDNYIPDSEDENEENSSDEEKRLKIEKLKEREQRKITKKKLDDRITRRAQAYLPNAMPP